MRSGLVFPLLVAPFVLACSDAKDAETTPAASLSDALVFEGLDEGNVPMCLDGTAKPSGFFRVRNVSNAPSQYRLVDSGVISTSTATLLDPGGVAIVRVEVIDVLGERRVD